MLFGFRETIIPTETSIPIYKGKMRHHYRSKDGEIIKLAPSCSVNDDLEILYELLKLGERLQESHFLFLHQMLTPNL